MGDEHRLTKTFTIRPSAFEGRGRYELLHTTEDRDNVRSRVIVRAGTAADVRKLGEALVRFAYTAHAEPARVPCEGWRKVGARSWRLVLNEYAEIEVWQPGERWTWELRLGSPMSKSLAEHAREPFDAPEAAMLAAEDAAADLLRAGLRAMGRE